MLGGGGGRGRGVKNTDLLEILGKDGQVHIVLFSIATHAQSVLHSTALHMHILVIPVIAPIVVLTMTASTLTEAPSS